jgi:hypothetical protein
MSTGGGARYRSKMPIFGLVGGDHRRRGSRGASRAPRSSRAMRLTAASLGVLGRPALNLRGAVARSSRNMPTSLCAILELIRKNDFSIYDFISYEPLPVVRLGNIPSNKLPSSALTVTATVFPCVSESKVDW